MALNNLEDLFIDELKDIYDAERRITRALPKMAKAASSEELASGFKEHLKQTEEHIARLERIFESLDKTPGRKTCQAMVGLLEEGQSLMEEDATEDVMDAALIAAAQKVEHYEIATYGCLRNWAETLGHDDAVKLFQKTLDEETKTDEKLTQLAQTINPRAAEGEQEEDEEEGAMVSSGKRSTGGSRPTGGKSRTR